MQQSERWRKLKKCEWRGGGEEEEEEARFKLGLQGGGGGGEESSVAASVRVAERAETWRMQMQKLQRKAWSI
jgi:hypothetical protein